jgi:Flp pilus assembly pilin Flp
MDFKPYLKTLIVATVAVAIIFRVAALKKAVTGLA